MRTLTHTVTPSQEGIPVRRLVPSVFHLGTHLFRRLKVQGGILVNGEPVHVSRVLRAGDVVSIRIDSPELTASSPLIRYMDEDLMIVLKPAPLPTLPGRDRGISLRERLCRDLGEPEETFVFHPVNRLDKGTSGLMCVARHDHAQRLLSAQLHTGSFRREYLAVTLGVPSPLSGTVDLPIAKAGPGARRCVSPEGRHAVTHYETLKICRSRALLRLNLETGRTHQIRVHLAALGCPIAGDYLYGTADPRLPDRFALHSARLCCTQPLTGQALCFDAPLPEELGSLLEAP
jgi:RluA family pseudouridine synthase